MTSSQAISAILAAKNRNAAAVVYAELLRTWPDSADWRSLNMEILSRWSMAGLSYIKERAWKIARNGNCYSIAVWEAEKAGPEALVCHGTAIGQGPIDGIPHGHAWVELKGVVIDRSNGADFVGPAVLYYALGKLTNIHRYKQDEVRRLLLKHKHYGPWEDSNA